MKRWTLLFILATWAGASWSIADEPPTGRMLTRGAEIGARGGRWIVPGTTPPDAPLRAFPSFLRDPTLADEPDGVLWRRMKAAQPGLDPLAVLSHPTDVARIYRPTAAQPDTVYLLALRVDFLGDSGGAGSTTLDGGFDLRPADSARVAVDSPPHNRAYFEAHMEALRRYFKKQSGGALELVFDVFPREEERAYHLADTGDYGPWIIAHSDEDLLDLAERLVRDAFALADEDTISERPDFRKYDSFLLLHAGADYQGDINQDSPYDIPSFNIQLALPVAVQDSSFFIDLILVVPEQVSQDGFTGALNGVLAHEYGHQLGFYDLYDVLTFYPQVGMFSLHDSGDQLYGQVWDEYNEQVVYVRGAIPASCDPWQKMIFFPDGVNARWIEEEGEFKLPPVQLNNDIALVPIGGQRYQNSDGRDVSHLVASEYFILENRPYDINRDGMVLLKSDPETGVILGPRNLTQGTCDSLELNCDSLGITLPDVSGEYEYDYLLPGDGLLIWHIDNVALADAFSYCYACVNVLPGRRAVDVEEADGIEDLGDIYSVEWTGGALDYWSVNGYSLFGPDTDPNTASSGGGVTGMTIEVLDDDPDSMGIGITLGPTRPNWPQIVGTMLGPEALTTGAVITTQAEIVAVGGTYLDAWRAEGGNVLEMVADSLLLPGVATDPTFRDGQNASHKLVAVASNTRVHVMEGGGGTLLTYPEGEQVHPTLRFTTPPMIVDSVVVIGDSEGRVRGLRPNGNPILAWHTHSQGYAVTALAYGEIFGSGEAALVWGDAAGRVHVATPTECEDQLICPGYTPVVPWPLALGSARDAIRWIQLIQAPVGEDGLILAVNDAGDLALWNAIGEMLPGWPAALASPPAGPPAVGDPDGDGQLEFVCTGRDGQVHVFDLDGREEPTWPRSVWHPDAWVLGSVRSGPILADLWPADGGDGRPEILQGSADGTLHMLTWDDAAIPGWPLVVGYSVVAGPVIAPTGANNKLEILAGDAGGYVTILRTGRDWREMLPGEMWHPAGRERQHLYPRRLLPEPVERDGLIDLASIAFTPNPARGARAGLRVTMGSQGGSVTVKLFDTAGQNVWEQAFNPEGGPQGDLLWLDVADLAPGLYVAKIVAERDGTEQSVMRKLALIR